MKNVGISPEFFLSGNRPEMEEIDPDWKYAPVSIYQDYGYTLEEIGKREVPTWDELQRKHDITIRAKVVEP